MCKDRKENDKDVKFVDNLNFDSTYVLITYLHSPSKMTKVMPKGSDKRLLSSTIDTSLRDPDFVDCFALSMTLRRVSCDKRVGRSSL